MNNEMFQQVITAPHEIMFQTVPVPQPNADEVLIRIHILGDVDLRLFRLKHGGRNIRRDRAVGDQAGGHSLPAGEGVVGRHRVDLDALLCAHDVDRTSPRSWLRRLNAGRR